MSLTFQSQCFLICHVEILSEHSGVSSSLGGPLSQYGVYCDQFKNIISSVEDLEAINSSLSFVPAFKEVGSYKETETHTNIEK